MGNAQVYRMGYKVGCGAFNDNCPLGSHSCNNKGNNQCSYDYASKGVCNEMKTYMDECPFRQPLTHSCIMSYEGFEQTGVADQKYSDDIYGSTSRCVLLDLDNYTDNRCLKSVCSADNSTVTFTNAQNISVVCNESLTKKPYGSQAGHFIYCPDIKEFCSLYGTKCKDNCNDRGLCTESGKCFCFDDTKGSDCSGQLTEEEKRAREAEIWGANDQGEEDTGGIIKIGIGLLLLLAGGLVFG